MNFIKTITGRLFTVSLAVVPALLITTMANADTNYLDNFSTELVMEVEMPWETDNSESIASTTSKVEFAVDAHPIEGVCGHAVFLWEGEGSVEVDEATIAVLDLWATPLYVEVGLKVIPFGVFNSSLISDPLAKELAETKEYTVQAGYAAELFSLGLGAYNGALDEADADNKPDNFFATVDFQVYNGILAGISWTSDMGEGGLEEFFTTLPDTTPYKNVAGLDLNLSADLNLFQFDLEYVTALSEWENVTPGALPLKPSSWNAEVACSLGDNYSMAVRYEGCADFPDQPENRYGIAGAYQLREYLSFGLEYVRSDFEVTDAQNTFTAKLALEI